MMTLEEEIKFFYKLTAALVEDDEPSPEVAAIPAATPQAQAPAVTPVGVSGQGKLSKHQQVLADLSAAREALKTNKSPETEQAYKDAWGNAYMALEPQLTNRASRVFGSDADEYVADVLGKPEFIDSLANLGDKIRAGDTSVKPVAFAATAVRNYGLDVARKQNRMKKGGTGGGDDGDEPVSGAAASIANAPSNEANPADAASASDIGSSERFKAAKDLYRQRFGTDWTPSAKIPGMSAEPDAPEPQAEPAEPEASAPEAAPKPAAEPAADASDETPAPDAEAPAEAPAAPEGGAEAPAEQPQAGEQPEEEPKAGDFERSAEPSTLVSRRQHRYELPALGADQHSKLIDAYIQGLASKNIKRGGKFKIVDGQAVDVPEFIGRGKAKQKNPEWDKSEPHVHQAIGAGEGILSDPERAKEAVMMHLFDKHPQSGEPALRDQPLHHDDIHSQLKAKPEFGFTGDNERKEKNMLLNTVKGFRKFARAMHGMSNDPKVIEAEKEPEARPKKAKPAAKAAAKPTGDVQQLQHQVAAQSKQVQTHPGDTEKAQKLQATQAELEKAHGGAGAPMAPEPTGAEAPEAPADAPAAAPAAQKPAADEPLDPEYEAERAKKFSRSPLASVPQDVAAERERIGLKGNVSAPPEQRGAHHVAGDIADLEREYAELPDEEKDKGFHLAKKLAGLHREYRTLRPGLGNEQQMAAPAEPFNRSVDALRTAKGMAPRPMPAPQMPDENAEPEEPSVDAHLHGVGPLESKTLAGRIINEDSYRIIGRLTRFLRG